MLQVVMLGLGIYYLYTGKIQQKTHKVEGWRARLIGGILLSSLPLSFVFGFAIGLYVVMTGGNPETVSNYALLIDIGVVIGVMVLAIILFNSWKVSIYDPSLSGTYVPGMMPPPPGSPPMQLPPSYPPVDPNNPYQPPSSR